MSNLRRPEWLPSAKWWAWQHRPWVTAFANTCLVIYPTGNLEGRYRRGGENADDYARGARQWTAPWGNHGGNDFINIFPHNQYCLKYGGKHDDQVDSTAQMLDWFKRGGQEPQDWMWQLYKQAQARGPQPTRPEPLSVMARRLGILRSLY
jgi:hypothetical protein